jgi:hypothetical protein
MKIEILIPSDEDLAQEYNFKGSIKLDEISMLAPVRRPEYLDDEALVVDFIPEGIGKHGAYEDTVNGRDFFVPVVPENFSILLSYPLSTHVLFKVTDGPEKGYSVADIILVIQTAYEEIYGRDESDAPNRSRPEQVEVDYMIPSGTELFGEWKHHIDVLALECLEIFRMDNGKYMIHAFIGS